MKKITLLLFYLLQSFYGRGKTTQEIRTDNPFKNAIDTVVQNAALAFMNDTSRVGLSIGIFKNGKTYTYNYGTVEKGKELLPSINTVYEIGSITKTFTSTLLAYAVLEKKVKLDDDIRKYLDGNYPNLVYEGKAIKLVHLANLTSGLPNWLPDNPDVFKYGTPDSIPFALIKIHKNYNRQNFYEDLHKVNLDTIPGSYTKHSNVAAQLLGYILERVYNTSYDDLLKKYILNFLKMKSTSFLERVYFNKKLLAKGYNQKGKIMPYITMKDVEIAGGLISSTSDMLKYLQFQLEEKNAAIKMSHQRTWGNIDDFAVGLNWHLGKTEKGIRQIWHTGGTFGFSSYCLFSPELNTGIVLLSNESDPTAQNELVNAAKKIFDKINEK